MSKKDLPVHPEVQSIYETCESEGVPLLDALLIALGVPDDGLSEKSLTPLRLLNNFLVGEGEMTPPQAASLIFASFDGLMGSLSPEQD
jgi:hypothetical protein